MRTCLKKQDWSRTGNLSGAKSAPNILSVASPKREDVVPTVRGSLCETGRRGTHVVARVRNEQDGHGGCSSLGVCAPRRARRPVKSADPSAAGLGRTRSVVPSHSTSEEDGGWRVASCSNRTAPSPSLTGRQVERTPLSSQSRTILLLSGSQTEVAYLHQPGVRARVTWWTPGYASRGSSPSAHVLQIPSRRTGSKGSGPMFISCKR